MYSVLDDLFHVLARFLEMPPDQEISVAAFFLKGKEQNLRVISLGGTKDKYGWTGLMEAVETITIQWLLSSSTLKTLHYAAV